MTNKDTSSYLIKNCGYLIWEPSLRETISIKIQLKIKRIRHHQFTKKIYFNTSYLPSNYEDLKVDNDNEDVVTNDLSNNKSEFSIEFDEQLIEVLNPHLPQARIMLLSILNYQISWIISPTFLANINWIISNNDMPF